MKQRTRHQLNCIHKNKDKKLAKCKNTKSKVRHGKNIVNGGNYKHLKKWDLID